MLYEYLVVRTKIEIGFDFRARFSDFAVGLREFAYYAPFALGLGFALGFLLLYNCSRGTLHGRAAAELQTRIYGESAPLRVAALPNAANPLDWRGLAETPESYAVVGLDLTEPFDPMRAQIFHKPDPSPAMDAASRSATFQQFLGFSQFPLWRVTPADEPENSTLVEIMDMRFGSPLAPGFMASALVDSRLRVLRTWFQFGVIRPR